MKDFQIETRNTACNCYAFGVAHIANASIVPGASQEPRPGSKKVGSESLAWMIDLHFKSQGCIRIDDIKYMSDIELIKTEKKHPYYLISVVYTKDDVHVLRAFHFPGKNLVNQLVWLQSGGSNNITFAKDRKEQIILGFPQDPEDFRAGPNEPSKFLGYYLVPTVDCNFFTPSGNQANFRLNECVVQTSRS